MLLCYWVSILASSHSQGSRLIELHQWLWAWVGALVLPGPDPTSIYTIADKRRSGETRSCPLDCFSFICYSLCLLEKLVFWKSRAHSCAKESRIGRI